MTFGKSFLASFLAFFAAGAVIIVLSIFIIAGIISSAEDKVIVKDNSVLHLKLDAQITELEIKNPLDALSGSGTPKIGLMDLKQAIKHAETDDKIKGIYLEVSQPLAGFSTIEEIRQSLMDFRKSGKWVLAYNETMSEGAYYLASAADNVYLYPEGEIEFNGLSIEIAFFKRLFDKLEIKPQIFRVGKFKSAVEPFFLEQMSEENRQQLTELTNSLNDVMLTKISESRAIDKAELKKISDGMLVRNAAQAKEYKLVDDLFYYDQFLDEVKKRLDTEGKVNLVSFSKYSKSFSTSNTSKNKIAVIVADGTIMPGKSDGKELLIGGETFVQQLQKAREDDDVKAIVMRVNSPGGEFRASDMIWREVKLAAEKKPVIASMSDYAASGGYYIAMAADTIVAQPHTITGSIGIFGVMFDMSGFLNDKIGVTFDEVKTGEFGEMYTVTRPLTEAEKNFWQKSLDEHYETFTSKAAEGRGVTQDAIKEVASGRVWSGEQALQHKLVDVLGGFDTAVDIAAEKAGIAGDYKLRFYPQQELTPLEEIITAFGEGQEEETLKAQLGEYYTWYLQYQKVKTYQGAQARMPFEFIIH